MEDVVHRMNEGYRAWGALKSVLSNRGLGIKAKKCLCEGVIVPTTLYGVPTALICCLGQQMNDGGGCVTMRERSERAESPGTYVTE